VDELYQGKKDKFLTVVCNLETAEPLWFGRERKKGIFSINRGSQVGFHEEPRSIVWARCLIRSAREGICLAPLTRSRMY
jgi:hypothetical protein